MVIRSTPTGNQIVHLNSTNSGIIVKNAVTPTKQSTLDFLLDISIKKLGIKLFK